MSPCSIIYVRTISTDEWLISDIQVNAKLENLIANVKTFNFILILSDIKLTQSLFHILCLIFTFNKVYFREEENVFILLLIL